MIWLFCKIGAQVPVGVQKKLNLTLAEAAQRGSYFVSDHELIAAAVLVRVIPDHDHAISLMLDPFPSLFVVYNIAILVL